jgi:acetyl-CoA carboxylase carboxyl transferase subunit beta
MARGQQVRASDLRDRGVVDRIVAEQPDAADEPEEFCRRVGEVLRFELARLSQQDARHLRRSRAQRFAAVSPGP